MASFSVSARGIEQRRGRRRIALAKQALRVQQRRAAVVGHKLVRALKKTQRFRHHFPVVSCPARKYPRAAAAAISQPLGEFRHGDVPFAILRIELRDAHETCQRIIPFASSVQMPGRRT